MASATVHSIDNWNPRVLAGTSGQCQEQEQPEQPNIASTTMMPQQVLHLPRYKWPVAGAGAAWVPRVAWAVSSVLYWVLYSVSSLGAKISLQSRAEETDFSPTVEENILCHIIPNYKVRYCTIRFNTIHYHKIPYKTIQVHKIPYSIDSHRRCGRPDAVDGHQSDRPKQAFREAMEGIRVLSCWNFRYWGIQLGYPSS